MTTLHDTNTQRVEEVVQVQSDAVNNESMATLTPFDTIDMLSIKDVKERAQVAVPNYTRSNIHLDTSISQLRLKIDANAINQTKKEINHSSIEKQILNEAPNMWANYGLADVGEVQINPKKSTDKNARYTPMPQPDPVASELIGCSVYTPLPDPNVNVTSNESWYGIASGPTSSLNP